LEKIKQTLAPELKNVAPVVVASPTNSSSSFDYNIHFSTTVTENTADPMRTSSGSSSGSFRTLREPQPLVINESPEARILEAFGGRGQLPWADFARAISTVLGTIAAAEKLKFTLGK
jgi:hypothetical protein